MTCAFKNMRRKAQTQQVSKPRVTKRRKKTTTEQQIYMARAVLSSKDVKTHYVTLAGTGITLAVPIYQTLTDTAVLVPGTSQLNQYIGSKIKPIGLTVRFKLAAGDATNYVRVGIFQNQGSTTTSPGNYYETTTDPASPIKSYPSNPFVCLYDKCISMVIGGDTQVMMWKVYIPAKRLMPVSFVTGGGAVTTGNLQVVALSDSAAAPNPVLSISSSLKYLDA